ncbi:hypothetical protein FCI23_42050 [Actinacidiphila oryziradicis]|uniref:EcsC family protein n=1 Tax=Actinacidiphila oryziradicis TaxID=2571141 RepID=A0A4U0SK99_9ACTN|nr:hypothetical protein FCI23_42050 [Actinacidiphila oryziradicis]
MCTSAATWPPPIPHPAPRPRPDAGRSPGFGTSRRQRTPRQERRQGRPRPAQKDASAQATNEALWVRRRDVASLADLRELDLADLDEVVRRLVLQWRSFGAAEGAALGALAMVPFAGGALAIAADLLVMQILTNAIVTRVCYAYGFDAKDPELQHVVRRMATRFFGEQVPKAATARSVNLAAAAAKGRKNWSKKLRDGHRILAALEKLMKQWNGVPNVSVGKAAKGLPVVAVVASTGTNAYVIGDVAKQARLYAQTLFLAEKYDLALPGLRI